jgi:zinc and cadmium transporter
MRTILNKNENDSHILKGIMSDLLVVILASAAAGLLSLSVALILLSSEKLSSKLVKYGTPFAAGVLLMIGFRDLLPEGIAEEGTQVLNATLGAVIIFFLIEKGFNSFHHHHEEDKPQDNKTQGWLFLIGDVFHNLIDGISLGGAFLLGRDTGLLATFALISHDIPLEVGEFGNQLRVGFTKKQTIIRNIVSGLTTIVGALLTYQLGGELDLPMGYLYGGIAGFFIYIALSDIVPTIHSSEKARYGLQTGFLLFGLIFGGTVSALAHEYIDVDHNHGEHGNHDEDDHDEEGHHEEDDHDEDDHDEEGHHEEDDHDEDDHDEEGHHEEDDHDEDDHDEEGHHEEDDHDEEAEVFVPNDVPDALVVLNYELNENIEIHFTADSEKEIHVHGYDIHFMVYPDKENVLELELTIAGEFEIEDHDGGFEFARLIVSP